ncbi:MAG: TonB-dependent receptor [Candidatus Adiutrix sp.]|nr:TonB-dependent receptor [Candidatus Adiutrix sp.]
MSQNGAWAQEPKNEEEAAEVALQEIEVRAAVRREELLSTSATVLENADLADRVFVQPLDMIKLSPGTSITQYGESGIAPAFTVRTFSAGHGGGDVTMYLDGIPLHDNGHADGYLDTGLIMPIEIERMEIIKGPSSVYYGQRAAGGALPIETIKGGNLTRLNLRYGSYNNMTATGLLAREQGDLSHVYAFETFHTDGWRDHSEWDKKNFSARWTYKVNEKFTTSLNVRTYQADWDSAGYIPYRLHLSPTTAVDDGSGQYNGGKRDRYDGRLWANYFINDNSQLTFYLYGTTLDHTRWQLAGYPANSTGPGTGTGGNGTEQFNTHKSYGSGLSYNFKGEVADREATVTVGVSYANEAEVRETYELPFGGGRKRGLHNSDRDFDVVTKSIFGEATYQILKPLHVRLGARYDMLGGDNTDNLAGTSQSSPTYKEFSPKAGLLYTPLDWLQIYANYGHGFSMPGLTYGTTFYEGGIYDLTQRDQYELGYRAALTDWIDLEMAAYLIYTKNDVTYDEQTNTSSPVGESKRRGLEASLAMRPWENWRLTGNYTYQDAKTTRGGSAAVSTNGRRLTNIPRHISNLELAYAPTEGLGGRVSFRWEADALLRDPSPVRRDGTPNYTYGPTGASDLVSAPYKAQDKGTLDMQLSYRFNENYRLVLDVLNVLDKEYYGSQGAPAYNLAGIYDFTYSIQPPRTFYLGLEMNWD